MSNSSTIIIAVVVGGFVGIILILFVALTISRRIRQSNQNMRIQQAISAQEPMVGGNIINAPPPQSSVPIYVVTSPPQQQQAPPPPPPPQSFGFADTNNTYSTPAPYYYYSAPQNPFDNTVTPLGMPSGTAAEAAPMPLPPASGSGSAPTEWRPHCTTVV